MTAIEELNQMFATIKKGFARVERPTPPPRPRLVYSRDREVSAETGDAR